MDADYERGPTHGALNPKSSADQTFEENQFEDIGLPEGEDFFETHNESMNYAYDTGREMIQDPDGCDMIELSAQQELLPRAMRPNEFE